MDEFGITEGAPVDRGFVFFDGYYVDAPYMVTRKGLSVFINDVMVERPARWPLPQPDPAAGKVDPEVPRTIREDTSQFNRAVVEHLGLKLAYLKEHCSSRDEVVRRMVDAYRQLPCVRSAEPEDRFHVRVVWSSGNVDSVPLFPPTGRARNDKQSLLESYEYLRESYEKRLREGAVYFLFSGGGQTSMGEESAVDVLPRVIGIVRSGMTQEEKFAAFQKMGWIEVVPESAPGKLVTDFRGSPQLEQRVDELLRRYGRKQIDDEPPSP